MSDLKVGDLVVKVPRKHRARCSCIALKKGVAKLGYSRTYTVAAITPGCRCEAGAAIKVAGVENRAPNVGFCRATFRKVVRDKHESCEPEFVTLIKRGKAPSPKEREKRILEALFPERAGARKCPGEMK